MKKEKIYSFDLIRGIGAIVIILFHIALYENIPWISAHGGSFNCVFFFISGFCMQYSKYPERIRKHDYSVLQFCNDKYKKLYITFFASLLVCYAVIGLRNIIDMLLDFSTLTPSWFSDETEIINGPSWFLCCLFFAYFVYYLVLRIPLKNNDNIIAIFIILVVIGRIIFNYDINIPFLRNSDGYAIMIFFSGCAFEFISEKLIPIVSKSTILLTNIFSFVVLLTILFIYCIYGNISFIGSNATMINCFIICPLIVWICLTNTVLNKICNNKVFSYMGSRSMYWFLWHIPVYSILHKILYNFEVNYNAIFIIVSIICIILLSELWNYLLNKQTIIHF